jgi:hypothetical protein
VIANEDNAVPEEDNVVPEELLDSIEEPEEPEVAAEVKKPEVEGKDMKRDNNKKPEIFVKFRVENSKINTIN